MWVIKMWFAGDSANDVRLVGPFSTHEEAKLELAKFSAKFDTTSLLSSIDCLDHLGAIADEFDPR